LGIGYVTDVQVSGRRIVATSLNGVGISDDLGLTWRSYANNTSDLNCDDSYAVDLDGETIYVATRKGLSLTANGGGNWTNIENVSTHLPLEDVVVTGELVLVTDGRIGGSCDGGRTWTWLDQANGVADAHKIATLGRSVWAATRYRGLSIGGVEVFTVTPAPVAVPSIANPSGPRR